MAFASNPLIFALRVVRGPWFMVFASFLIMAASGATYAFAVYSKDIKSAFGYDQRSLNTVAFFKDIGSNVGILAGLINEIAPPWLVLSIGSIMNLFGYLMLYLSITGHIPRPALWQVCLFVCVGANSQTFANTGALVTTVKNFPESRGIVIGLLKGFVGLSSAIFTQLYLAFYGDDSKSLVLLIAWLPAAVSIVLVHTIRIMKFERRTNEFKVFCSFLYLSLVLAGYLMIMIIVERTTNFSRAEYGVTTAIVLLLLFLPLAIVVKEQLPHEDNSSHVEQNTENHNQITTTDSTSEIPSTRCLTKKPAISRIVETMKPPKRGEDYSIIQALFSVDMIILFISTICGIGGTLTAIDNMGQIGQSLGYPARSIGTFVSLISIWNYMGRVTSGFASEILIKKYGLPRPFMLALVLVLSCTGHLLIAFAPPGSLYVASVIVGFCFGAQMPLLFAIISELFGLKYYSTLSNILGVTSPLSTYLMNVRVAGYLYDRESVRQNGKLSTCIGVQCYRLTFFIITGVTLVGAIAAMFLAQRTRKFYKSDIYARFREEPACGKELDGTVDGGVEEGKGSMLVQ